MWALYLVSKCLPRVCMGGSNLETSRPSEVESAPRVHGWFLRRGERWGAPRVCPACAWVVPSGLSPFAAITRLPRVCMGGSI